MKNILMKIVRAAFAPVVGAQRRGGIPAAPAALALALALVLGLALGAQAGDKVYYLHRYWDSTAGKVVTETKSTTTYKVIDGSDHSLGDDADAYDASAGIYCYVVNDDIDISENITVQNNVLLVTLCDLDWSVWGYLTAESGIFVTSGSALTLATGSMDETFGEGGGVTADGSGGGVAGIGGEAGASVTINGGQYEIKGGNGAAGIGGANGCSGPNITINSSYVSSYAGSGAAAIGGGKDGGGASITINDGEIVAVGGSNVGIGDGNGGSGSNTTINGGDITIKGSVGIQSSGAVVVGGGDVSVTGTAGPGISSGSVEITGGTLQVNGSTTGIQSSGTAAISGGVVNATGSAGAGISAGTAEITGGRVLTTGSSIGIQTSGAIAVGNAGVTAIGTTGAGISASTVSVTDNAGIAACGTIGLLSSDTIGVGNAGVSARGTAGAGVSAANGTAISGKATLLSEGSTAAFSGDVTVTDPESGYYNVLSGAGLTSDFLSSSTIQDYTSGTAFGLSEKGVAILPKTLSYRNYNAQGQYTGDMELNYRTAGTATLVLASDTTWDNASTMYVSLGGLLEQTVTVGGAVKLLLVDRSNLTVMGTAATAESAHAGICVHNDTPSSTAANTFTVYAQSAGEGIGRLCAFGTTYSHDAARFNSGAGIGGNGVSSDKTKNSGSNITINGGNVTASSGGYYAAGIGGGCYCTDGWSDYYGGGGSFIVINGGTVTTVGGCEAASIGGGFYNDGTNITINGGTVIANAGVNGVGIGGGKNGNGSHITISGGTVTATGHAAGAGIGGGEHVVYGGDCFDVTISGGTVTAIGGEYGAGIGGGYGGSGTNITISGGSVTATGGASGVAGIGSGSGGAAAANICIGTNLTVKASNVNDPPLAADKISDGVKTDFTADLSGKRYATVTMPAVAYRNYADGAFVDASVGGEAGPVYAFINGENLPTTWSAGYYVVGDDYNHDGVIDATDATLGANTFTISETVSTAGDVKLILADGFTLNVTPTAYGAYAISGENPGATFTVYAQSTGDGAGVLNVTGMNSASDDGKGGEGISMRDGVTLNGGKVTCTGGQGWQSGFQGGAGGNGIYSFKGNITLNGGKVTATGGSSGSGAIGISGCGVVINGDTVYAQGGTGMFGPADGIYASDTTITIARGLVVRADVSTNPPETVVSDGTKTDFTSDLSDKRYVRITAYVEVKASDLIVANTSIKVLSDGEEVAKTGDKYLVESNMTAIVVYTADAGYAFDGTKVCVTNTIDTSVNPAKVAAPAAPTAAHQHCVCGTGACTAGGHAHVGVVWTAWKGTESLPTTAGNYYLANDIVLTSSSYNESAWLMDGVNICLNGHSIIQNNDGEEVVIIYNNAKASITDCAAMPGAITHASGVKGQGLSTNGSGCDFTLWNGLVCSNDYYNAQNYAFGAGMSVSYGSTVRIYGGEFFDNKVTRNGNNAAGGAICSCGTLYVYGGTFRGNSSGTFGGALAAGWLYGSAGAGVIHIYDGVFTNNVAEKGGALASVHGNVDPAIYVHGGLFANNSLAGSALRGGAIFTSTTLTLDGGVIRDNTCGAGCGGGVYVESTGSLTLGGTVSVTNNAAAGRRDNLAQYSGKTLAFSTDAPLDPSARIGVTVLDSSYASAKGTFSATGAAAYATNFVADAQAAYCVNVTAAGALEIADRGIVEQPTEANGYTCVVNTNGFEGTVAYQWYRVVAGGTDEQLAGETAAKLALDPVKGEKYYCNVTLTAKDALVAPAAIKSENAEKPHTHCLCGDGQCEVGAHEHSNLVWQAWESTTSLPTAAGNWYLTADVTLTYGAKATIMSGTVNICLNGHTVNGAASTEVFYLGHQNGDATKVSVTDCTEAPGHVTHKAGDAGYGVYILADSGYAEFNFYRGSIDGNSQSGIYAYRNAKINLYGGSITNNTVNSTPYDGGGIHLKQNSTLTMYDGLIGYNYSGEYGGGIYSQMKNYNNAVVIEGGSICCNTCKYSGAGIYGDNITVNGGNICTNVTCFGGAIYGNTVTITNGLFCGNTAESSGGVLYGEDILIKGGTFCDNVASNQGGVVSTGGGTLTVTGGEFRRNHAESSGGAFYVSHASAQIAGGDICDNTAPSGGAIGVGYKGQVELSGITISGNRATKGGVLYVPTSATGVVLTNVCLTGNCAENQGGAIWYDCTSGLTLNDVDIRDNVANDCGAGIYLRSGVVTVGSGVSVTNNFRTAITNDNIYLNAGAKVELTTDHANDVLGIKPAAEGVFTTKGCATEADMALFRKDDETYLMRHNDDDTLEFYSRVKVQPETANDFEAAFITNGFKGTVTYQWYTATPGTRPITEADCSSISGTLKDGSIQSTQYKYVTVNFVDGVVNDGDVVTFQCDAELKFESGAEVTHVGNRYELVVAYDYSYDYCYYIYCECDSQFVLTDVRLPGGWVLTKLEGETGTKLAAPEDGVRYCCVATFTPADGQPAFTIQTDANVKHHKHADATTFETQITTESELRAFLTTRGDATACLVADMKIASCIEMVNVGTKHLCLNGHVLDLLPDDPTSDYYSVVTLEKGSKLIIDDCNETRTRCFDTSAEDGRWAVTNETTETSLVGGCILGTSTLDTFKLYQSTIEFRGGTIAGSGNDGWEIFMLDNNNSRLDLTGGNFVGNGNSCLIKSYSNNTIRMTDGEIRDNDSKIFELSDGCTVDLLGGVICDNVRETTGVVLSADNSRVLIGGDMVISNNESSTGAICLNNTQDEYNKEYAGFGWLTICGKAQIVDNRCTQYGGAVLFYGGSGATVSNTVRIAGNEKGDLCAFRTIETVDEQRVTTLACFDFSGLEEGADVRIAGYGADYDVSYSALSIPTVASDPLVVSTNETAAAFKYLAPSFADQYLDLKEMDGVAGLVLRARLISEPTGVNAFTYQLDTKNYSGTGTDGSVAYQWYPVANSSTPITGDTPDLPEETLYYGSRRMSWDDARSCWVCSTNAVGVEYWDPLVGFPAKAGDVVRFAATTFSTEVESWQQPKIMETSDYYCSDKLKAVGMTSEGLTIYSATVPRDGEFFIMASYESSVPETEEIIIKDLEIRKQWIDYTKPLEGQTAAQFDFTTSSAESGSFACVADFIAKGGATTNFTLTSDMTSFHVNRDAGGNVTEYFDQEIATAADLETLLASGGNGYLATNIVLSTPAIVAAGVTNKLCLCGYSIANDYAGKVSEVLEVSAGAKLTLYDCGTTPHYFTPDPDTGRWMPTNVTTECVVYGGYIYGGDNVGVYVKSGGAFELRGGNIVGCTGIGVGVLSGAFVMGGGEIVGNAMDGEKSGAVFVSNGSFVMTNGVIRNNNFYMGSGIFAAVSEIVLGGDSVISNNTQTGFGSVFAQECIRLTVRDRAQIVNNRASSTSAGLFALATPIVLEGTPRIAGNDYGDLVPLWMDMEYARSYVDFTGLTEGAEVHVASTVVGDDVLLPYPEKASDVCIISTNITKEALKYVKASLAEQYVMSRVDGERTLLELHARFIANPSSTNDFTYQLDEKYYQKGVGEGSVAYQWYPAKVEAGVVTDKSSCLVMSLGEISTYAEYDSETKTWSGECKDSADGLIFIGFNAKKGTEIVFAAKAIGTEIQAAAIVDADDNFSDYAQPVGSVGDMTLYKAVAPVDKANYLIFSTTDYNKTIIVSNLVVSTESIDYANPLADQTDAQFDFTKEEARAAADDGVACVANFIDQDAATNFTMTSDIASVHANVDKEGEVEFFETKISSADDLTALLKSGGSGYLTTNIVLSSYATIKSGITNKICLCGHSIANGSETSHEVFDLYSGSCLTLCDCDDKTAHYFTPDPDTGRWIPTNVTTECVVYGGYIYGGIHKGVYVDSDALFEMRGGNVVGCTKIGVQVESGAFKLNGGEIVGNALRDPASYESNSAAVYINLGSFVMTNGVIRNNNFFAGSGIQAKGGDSHNCHVALLGGVIRDNTAIRSSAACDAYNAELVLSGDLLITNNTLTSAGSVAASGCRVTVRDSVQIVGNHATGICAGLLLQDSQAVLEGTPRIAGNDYGDLVALHDPDKPSYVDFNGLVAGADVNVASAEGSVFSVFAYPNVASDLCVLSTNITEAALAYVKPSFAEQYVQRRQEGAYDLLELHARFISDPSATNDFTYVLDETNYKGGNEGTVAYQWYPSTTKKEVITDQTPDRPTQLAFYTTYATYDPATQTWSGEFNGTDKYLFLGFNANKGDEISFAVKLLSDDMGFEGCGAYGADLSSAEATYLGESEGMYHYKLVSPCSGGCFLVIPSTAGASGINTVIVSNLVVTSKTIDYTNPLAGQTAEQFDFTKEETRAAADNGIACVADFIAKGGATTNFTMTSDIANVHANVDEEGNVEFFETKISGADDLTALLKSGGSGYLATDVELSKCLEISGAVTSKVCLCGHSIVNGCVSETNRVLLLREGVNLTFCDCDKTPHYFTPDPDTGRWIPSNDETECVVYGGYIYGGMHVGVCVYEESTFELKGGSIVGCSSCGVYGSESKILVSGGAIVGNTAWYYDSNEGKYQLSKYCALYLESSKFVMTDGEIRSNRGESAAGINMQNSTAELTGGVIADNVADEIGSALVAYQSDVVFGGDLLVTNNQQSGYATICLMYANIVVRDRARIVGNAHEGIGGGIVSVSSGTVTVSNEVQIAGNYGGDLCAVDIFGDFPTVKLNDLSDGAKVGLAAATLDFSSESVSILPELADDPIAYAADVSKDVMKYLSASFPEQYLEREEDGTLLIRARLIAQPSAANEFTYELDKKHYEGVPGEGTAKYQWYPVKEETGVVTDKTPDLPTNCDGYTTYAKYDSATETWSGVYTGYSDGLVFLGVNAVKGTEITFAAQAVGGDISSVEVWCGQNQAKAESAGSLGDMTLYKVVAPDNESSFLVIGTEPEGATVIVSNLVVTTASVDYTKPIEGQTDAKFDFAKYEKDEGSFACVANFIDKENFTTNFTMTSDISGIHVNDDGKGGFEYFDQKISTTDDLVDLLLNGGAGYLADDLTIEMTETLEELWEEEEPQKQQVMAAPLKYWYTPHWDNGTLQIAAGTEVALCLKGHVLDLNGTYVQNNGQFRLTDCDAATPHYFAVAEDMRWTVTNELESVRSVKGGVVTGGVRGDYAAIQAGAQFAATTLVSRVNFIGNGSAICGGYETLVEQCRFSGNVRTPLGFFGGTNQVVRECLVTENIGSMAGGISKNSEGDLTLIDVTVTNNYALGESEYDGAGVGGFFFWGDGAVALGGTVVITDNYLISGTETNLSNTAVFGNPKFAEVVGKFKLRPDFSSASQVSVSLADKAFGGEETLPAVFVEAPSAAYATCFPSDVEYRMVLPQADGTLALCERPIVSVTLPDIGEATAKIYTNGFEVAEPWTVFTNYTVEVVYTANPDCCFADGSTEKKRTIVAGSDPTVLEQIKAIVPASDLVIADNYETNPLFTDLGKDAHGNVTFKYGSGSYTNGVNAFLNFREAFEYGPANFATNVHTFGFQTIPVDTPFNKPWRLRLVDATEEGGLASVLTIGTDAAKSLVNATNRLDVIYGTGTIVLSVPEGTPGADVYKSHLEGLRAEGVDVEVVYANFEPQKEKDENPDGKVVTNATLTVTDQSKVEEDGTVVLPGVDTSGKIVVDVTPSTTNDVVVAGKLKSREWDVVIVNETTNLLTVGAVETGMNVLITNVLEESQIVTLDNVIAGKKIKIENHGHLEADAHATDSIVILNTSVHTLAGTYKSGTTIDITGDYGSLSNVVIYAKDVLTVSGTNVISGPVDLKSDTNNGIKYVGTTKTEWSVAGDNGEAMIDWDDVVQSDMFGVMIDEAQATGDTVGTYVIASNAADAVGTDFTIVGGGLATNLTVSAEQNTLYIGAKAFTLTNAPNGDLVFDVAYGKFDISYDAMGGAWTDGETVTVSNLDAYVNRGYEFPAANPVRDGYVFRGWYRSWSNGAERVTNLCVEVEAGVVRPLAAHALYAQWMPDAANPASRRALSEILPSGDPRLAITRDDGFRGNVSVSTLDVPVFVTRIGEESFRGASNLRTVNFTQPRSYADGSLAELEIGDYAFMGCALEEVVIPACVTTIGKRAFNGCNYLKKITLLGTPAGMTVGGQPFNLCGTKTAGGLTISLAPAAATNAAFVAALTNGCTSVIQLAQQLDGEVSAEVTECVPASDEVRVTITYTGLGIVNARSVSALYGKTPEELVSAPKCLVPTSVTPTGDPGKYECVFRTGNVGASEGFFRVCVGESF